MSVLVDFDDVVGFFLHFLYLLIVLYQVENWQEKYLLYIYKGKENEVRK